MRIQAILVVAIVLHSATTYAAEATPEMRQPSADFSMGDQSVHYFPGVVLPGSIPGQELGSPTLNPVLPSETPKLKYSGSALWTGMLDVELRDHIAYCAMVHGLAIFDVTDPTNPRWLSSVFLPHGSAIDVFVRDDYAYLADGTAGLQIVNISDPRSPYLVSTHAAPLYAHDVEVAGHYAYVASSTALQIFDISNPTSPQKAGDRPFALEAWAVVVSGQVAYVAAGNSGLQVVNVTNPAEPVLLKSFPITNRTEVVAVSGSRAYAQNYESTLFTWDITHPEQPVAMGAAGGVATPLDMQIVGNFLYGAIGDLGLYITDISNPLTPVHVGWLDSIDYAIGVGIQGRYAYVADPWEGLNVVALPAHDEEPSIVGRYVTSFPSIRIAAGGNRAVVAGYDSYRDYAWYVTVLDLARPSTMAPLGTFRCAGMINDMELSDGLAYVADNGMGLRILDVSKHEAPVLVSTYGDVIPRDIAIWRSRAFLATNQGLQILDISDPTSPKRMAEMRGIGVVASVVTNGHYAYVSDDASRVQVIDVSEPTAPRAIGIYESGRTNVHAIAEDHLYLLNPGQMQILNVADPFAPSKEGAYYFADAAVSLNVVGDYAVVAVFSHRLGQAGIQLIDISDPMKPAFAGFYSTGGLMEDAYVDQGHVYVADFFALLALSLELDHGDVNGDSTLSMADVRYLVDYLFAAGPSPKPTPSEGDADCSGTVDVLDVIRLVNHMFRGGLPPC